MPFAAVPVVTVLGCCALFAALAVPLMLRKVPPNVVYGYRTRATLQDTALWYDANEHFGRGLFAASLFSGVAVLALGATHAVEASLFPLVAVVVFAAPTLIAGLATARFIRSRRAK